jgi:threonine dehydratase
VDDRLMENPEQGRTTPSAESELLALLDFEAASAAVAGTAAVTPLLEAPALSDRVGAPVYLKLENLQTTGSFKVRGAAARLSVLTPEERERGIVACSSGNHGRAVAHVAQRFGVRATVYVPEWVDSVKLAGIRGADAEAVLEGATFDESEVLAMEEARRSGRPYVSAYDDPWVIAGQGTLALEILDALPQPPSAVLVPLSGGGIVAGVAGALRWKLGRSAPPAVAVTAERAAGMLASLQAGRPLEIAEQDTVASALAGGLRPDNRYSFALVQGLVSDHVTVTEDEIKGAMRFAISHLHIVAEGGGAVGIAALLADRWQRPANREGPVVVVVSGGNVAPETLASVLTEATERDE